MSKYKVGDKVVMKIISADQDEIKTYSVSGVGNNWRWRLPQNLLERYTEPLSTYTEPLEAKIRRQAAEITRLLAENKELKDKLDNRCDMCIERHEKEVEQARAEGAETAWELARKIVLGGKDCYSCEDLKKIFDYGYSQAVMRHYTYLEAAAKVAEWEKAKEEIKVGDVVSHEGFYGVVKSVSDDWLNGITASGVNFQWLKCKCTKTGRHIDIDSFLKQIGGESDEK